MDKLVLSRITHDTANAHLARSQSPVTSWPTTLIPIFVTTLIPTLFELNNLSQAMKTSFLIALFAVIGTKTVLAFSSCCFQPPFAGIEEDGATACADCDQSCLECDQSCLECLSMLQLCKQVANDDNAQLCSQQAPNWVADSYGSFAAFPQWVALFPLDSLSRLEVRADST